MQRHTIVVLGASFAGIAAALELERRLSPAHDIVVVSKAEDFVFLPSLVWVPFGLREKRDISFPLADFFAKRRVRFVHAAVREIDLDARTVQTSHGGEPWTKLVIATGAKQDFRAIRGLGPIEGHTQSIFAWDDAWRARGAIEKFLRSPGPIVVGCVQGASTFSPAYEFASVMARRLRERGLSARCPITLVTPEPFVGHLGVGDLRAGGNAVVRAMETEKIEVVTNARIEEIGEHHIRLAGGRSLPISFAMLTPPFVGVDPVRACTSIVDARGFVAVDRSLRSRREDVWAAGLAVATPPVVDTEVPIGRPITGALSEEMGRIAARNIVAAIDGSAPEEIDLDRVEYVVDAGVAGHWAKAAYERYFLSTRRRGLR